MREWEYWSLRSLHEKLFGCHAKDAKLLLRRMAEVRESLDSAEERRNVERIVPQRMKTKVSFPILFKYDG